MGSKVQVGGWMDRRVVAGLARAYRAAAQATRCAWATTTSTDTLRGLGFLCVLGTATACGPKMHPGVDAPTRDPSRKWASLLERAITDDGVDYDLIEQERALLDSYVAWVGEHGPEMDQWGESKEDRRLSFLLNAYNASVIYGVLEHRPLESVRDVKVGGIAMGGVGFFARQRFKVDGDWQSLYVLEHQGILGRYQEPLAHIGMNCASKGCPPVRWWSPNNLQDALERAMRDWLASDGLRQQGEDYLASEIFDWFEDDFLDWSEADTICEWMVDYTAGPRKRWMKEHAENCDLQTFPYDWSLNAIPAQTTPSG